MAECGFSRAGRARRRPGGLAAAAGALSAGVALSACSGADGDVRAERCLEVLRYRRPELTAIAVEDVARGPRVRTLAFRARTASDDPLDAPRVRDRITCRFAPDDPWSIAAVEISGRALSPGEIALVNAELLLLDLSRHPERLGGETAHDDARASLGPCDRPPVAS